MKYKVTSGIKQDVVVKAEEAPAAKAAKAAEAADNAATAATKATSAVAEVNTPIVIRMDNLNKDEIGKFCLEFLTGKLRKMPPQISLENTIQSNINEKGVQITNVGELDQNNDKDKEWKIIEKLLVGIWYTLFTPDNDRVNNITYDRNKYTSENIVLTENSMDGLENEFKNGKKMRKWTKTLNEKVRRYFFQMFVNYHKPELNITQTLLNDTLYKLIHRQLRKKEIEMTYMENAAAAENLIKKHQAYNPTSFGLSNAVTSTVTKDIEANKNEVK